MRSSSPSVLAVVDEDAAPLLQPLRGHLTGMVSFEQPRGALGEGVGLLERRTARDRRDGVDAVGAARLHVPRGRPRRAAPGSDARPRSRARSRRPADQIEENEARPVRLVDAQYQAFDRRSSSGQSEHGFHGIQQRKSTSREPPSRGWVVNRRVGIHSGIPFGACFWKNTSPLMPCG